MTEKIQRSALDLGRKSVLAIDENPFGLKLIVDICKGLELGSVATCKATGHVLAALAAAHYDVVICDWGAPPLDGPAMVRQVRASADARIKRASIILLKANASAADVTAAREAGVTEFLARPFSAQALLHRLTAIFSKPRDFVSDAAFTGPDRRRRGAAEKQQTRRSADAAKE